MDDNHFDRRTFLKSAGLAIAGMSAFGVTTSFISAAEEEQLLSETVNFTRDGLDFTPEEYIRLLARLTAGKNIAPDSYSNGGIVAELENRMARILGKEAAVYMPTGTLANHIAVRMLSGTNTRVLVQAESHLYNDSGDAAQSLSGLNLIPLAKGESTFSLEDVKNEIGRAADGKVTTGVGVISIESPVRRRDNCMFDWEEMKAIATLAQGLKK